MASCKYGSNLPLVSLTVAEDSSATRRDVLRKYWAASIRNSSRSLAESGLLHEYSRHLYNKNVRVSVVHLVGTQDEEHLEQSLQTQTLAVLDWNSATHKEFLMISRLPPFCDAKWLVFVEEAPAFDFLQELYIPFNCEFIAAEHNVTGGAFVLWELYQVSRNTAMRRLRYGSWRQGRLKVTSDYIWNRRRDLQGFELIASTLIQPPFSIGEEINGLLEVKSFYVGVWKALAERMNFTTRLTRPPDNAFGAMGGGGAWNGMVGQVARGEAFAAVHRITITAERAQVLRFTHPLQVSRLGVHVRALESERHLWAAVRTFVAPFSPLLWATAAAVGVVFAVALPVVRAPRSDGDLLGWRGSWLLTCAVLCSQSAEGCAQARRVAARVALWFASVPAVALSSAYSAALVARLAVRTLRQPFHTFEGLLYNSPPFRLAVLQDSVVLGYFKRDQRPVLRELFERHLSVAGASRTLPRSVSEGLSRVCAERAFAFVASFDNVLHALPCDVLRLRHASFSDTIALALPRASPLAPLFDHTLMNLKRLGIIHKLFCQHWPIALHEASDGTATVAVSPAPALEIWQMLPIVLVVLMGVVAAMAVLLTEKTFRGFQGWIEDRQSRRRWTRRYGWS